jgi:predicted ATP-dependent endonuclease of OLD family
MRIETVYIKGFRNYCDAVINFNETNLIIGANDVGKPTYYMQLDYYLIKVCLN